MNSLSEADVAASDAESDVGGVGGYKSVVESTGCADECYGALLFRCSECVDYVCWLGVYYGYTSGISRGSGVPRYEASEVVMWAYGVSWAVVSYESAEVVSSVVDVWVDACDVFGEGSAGLSWARE